VNAGRAVPRWVDPFVNVVMVFEAGADEDGDELNEDPDREYYVQTFKKIVDLIPDFKFADFNENADLLSKVLEAVTVPFRCGFPTD
jgi:hypothetical protein